MASTQSPSAPRKGWFAWLLPLLAIIAITLLLTGFLNYLLETARWGEHTERVIAQAFRVEKLAVDMETGLRGFQLSQDVAYLEPFQHASAVIRKELETLKSLVSDNPQQQERTMHIQIALDKWSDFAAGILARARAKEEINRSALNDHGKELMDDTRREIGWFLEQEQLLLEMRHGQVVKIEHNISIYRTLLLTVAGVAIGFYMLWHCWRRFRPSEPEPIPQNTRL